MAARNLALKGYLYFFFLLLSFSAETVHARRVMRLACVDCYGSASFIVSEARKMYPNIEFIFYHIQTAPIIDAYKESWARTRGEYEENFQANLEDPKVRASLGQKLKDLGVIYAFSGMEDGAYQSGWINLELKTPLGFNNPHTRDLRRHKAKMQKALKKYGIPTAFTLSWEEALRHIRQQTKDEIVLKLPKSSAGEGMYIGPRTDEKRLKEEFEKLLEIKIDHYGHPIDGIIVQPRIVGREIVPNTLDAEGPISGEGQIIGAIEYHRPTNLDGKHLYLIDRSLDLEDRVVNVLRKPLYEASIDLDYKYGPGHWEWMVTSEGETYLIEMGSRLAGGSLPMIEKEVYGTSQLHEEIRRIVDPEDYRRNPPRPKKTKYGMQLSIISFQEGRISEDVESFSQSLRTLLPIPGLQFVPGQRIKQTVDLDTAAVNLGLAGTYSDLYRDANKILSAATSEKILLYDDVKNCSEALLKNKLVTIERIWSTFENAFSYLD